MQILCLKGKQDGFWFGVFFFCVFLFSSLTHAKTAPSFRGEATSGEQYHLKDFLKPGRAVLVSFWATWCGPCIQELKEVSKKLKLDPTIPLDIVSVNVDTAETSSSINSVIKENKFQFPVILDPSHEIFSKYQSMKTVPYSVLLSSKGEIEEIFNGYDEKLIEKVKKVVGDKKKS